MLSSVYWEVKKMKSKIDQILKKELREMFRDKKSLLMMLIIPVFIPLLVLGMSALFESQMNRPIEEYNKIGIDYSLTSIEQNIMAEMQIDPVTATKDELEEKFMSGEISLYITKEENIYTIHGDDSDTTTMAKNLAENYLNAYKEYLQQEYLVNHQMNANDVLNILSVEEDIEASDNYFANYITSYAFMFIIMAITVSATYPATDATAGEKERGTLETLLTFPVKSRDIILGKFFSVSISSVITGVLSLILTLLSLLLANNMFEIYKSTNLMLSLPSIFYALVVIIVYSFLISGLCIAIASKSKTFKEAQSALTPLTFISFFPSMIAFMMNVESNAILSCIPFLNFTLLFTDIVNENLNLINMILMILSTLIIIAVVLKIIIAQYKSEKVLFNQ